MSLEKILRLGKNLLITAILSTPSFAQQTNKFSTEKLESIPIIGEKVTEVKGQVTEGNSLLKGAQKVPLYLLDTATSMGGALRSRITGEEFESMPIFSDTLPTEYMTYLGYTPTLHDEKPNAWQYLEDKDINNLGSKLAPEIWKKREDPQPIPKPSTRKWTTGIWIRETQSKTTVTPETLESQGLYQAGFCVDESGNLYQVYSSRRFPAFTEKKSESTVAVYHTDTSSGVKITERNNTSLETLRQIDETTVEQTTIDTQTGKTLKKNIFKKK